jgi:DNA polymerase-3 subunit gamma/tau
MTPLIVEGTQVEVTVDNALVKHDMDQIYKSILKTLQVYLNNSQLSLTIRVSDKPAETKILTRREQFEEMRQKNPAVEALRQAFDLELA